jgi:hypothetical protein
MTTHAEEYWRDTRGLRVLWAGVLLGPAAWAVNLQANYTLATFACEGWWPLTMHAVTIVSIGVALSGAWLGWRSWQALEPLEREKATLSRSHRIDRSRFMALSGIVLSLYFALTIAAQWIPTFMLAPCHY